MNNIFNMFQGSFGMFGNANKKYNPLINYDWSTTTAKEYKTDGVELVDSTFSLTPSDGNSEAWKVYNPTQADIVNGTFEVHTTGASNLIVKYNSVEIGAKYVIDYISDTNVVLNISGAWYALTIGNNKVVITPTSTNIIVASGGTPGTVNISKFSIQKVIEEPNKRYLKDVGSTPTYNASMYFGRGAYLNGVDQSITVPINATIQTALKRVNGVVTINETSQTLTNYVISGLGVHKDYYLFTRLLTTAEKDSYTNTPELFYAMAQADSTCVLNMPMCETDGYVRNMKSYSEGVSIFNSILSSTNIVSTAITGGRNLACAGTGTGSELTFFTTTTPNLQLGEIYYLSFNYSVNSGTAEMSIVNHVIPFLLPTSLTGIGKIAFVFTSSRADPNLLVRFNASIAFNISITDISIKKLSGVHSITNYTTSVRDNAKNLQYGLQTCKFVRDSLGVIQSASNYLECNGTGYAIIPNHADTVNIKMTVNPTSLSGNLLSGGVTKALTGLTLNVDNDVVISNVTPTGAITLASGFSGTIKTYTEELV